MYSWAQYNSAWRLPAKPCSGKTHSQLLRSSRHWKTTSQLENLYSKTSRGKKWCGGWGGGGHREDLYLRGCITKQLQPVKKQIEPTDEDNGYPLASEVVQSKDKLLQEILNISKNIRDLKNDIHSGALSGWASMSLQIHSQSFDTEARTWCYTSVRLYQLCWSWLETRKSS